VSGRKVPAAVSVGPVGHAAAPAWALGWVGVGALFAFSAFALHPLLLPALFGLGVLAGITVSRPEIGLAASFPMVPLTYLGVTGKPPWLMITAWSAFLFALALWRGSGDGDRRFEVPAIGGALLVFLAVSLAAMSYTLATDAAFSVMRALGTGAMLFVAMATLVRDRAQVGWVLGGATLAAVLAGGYGAWEYFSGSSTAVGFVTSSGALVNRADAGFGQPNGLGGYLVVLIPFAVAGAILYRRRRLLYIAGVLIAVLGIYATFSRAALLGLAVIPFIFFGRQLLWLVPLLLLGALVVGPDILRERFATLTLHGAEIATRVDIWRGAVGIWAQDPLLGTGLGSFPDAYAAIRVPEKAFLPSGVFRTPPHAHNSFLHVLAEQGLVGLMALLGLLFAALRTAVRLSREFGPMFRVLGTASLASLAAFLVHSQFDVVFLEGLAINLLGLFGLMSAVAVQARST
jgi:O-antigen ligase